MLAPEVEARPWAEQLALDDASYRKQLAYLFDRSAFYREKLGDAGFASAEAAGGLADIARAAAHREGRDRRRCTPEDPIGAHLCASRSEIVRIYSTSGTTGHAELHSADGGRSRQLGDRLGAQLRGFAASPPASASSRPTMPGRSWPARHLPPSTARPLPYPGRHREHRAADAAIELLKPEAAVLTPSYAAYLLEWAAERGLRSRGVERGARARGGRAGRRRAGVPREARRGLGREGHRGDGHRRHRRYRCGANAKSKTACIWAPAALSMPN